MEIERKFLISKENLPSNLDSYPHHKLEQGYLSTSPVVRIRKEDDNYYLTYKSKGLMTREEYNLPLTKESYKHMRPKADGYPHFQNTLSYSGKRRTYHRTGCI